jgi:hypothetical protein
VLIFNHFGENFPRGTIVGLYKIYVSPHNLIYIPLVCVVHLFLTQEEPSNPKIDNSHFKGVNAYSAKNFLKEVNYIHRKESGKEMTITKNDYQRMWLETKGFPGIK